MTETLPPTSAVDWAKEHGRFFGARVIAGEPGWKLLAGWMYDQPESDVFNGIVLERALDVNEDPRVIWLFTDGNVTRAYYVAGWHMQGRWAILREVKPDMQGMAPKPCYHLVVTWGEQ